MAQVWELEGLGPNDRLVLLCLADHADDGGTCYPSVPRIMARTGLSDRGVQKALKRLEGVGMVSVRHGGGRGNSNSYTINPEPHSPNAVRNPEPHSPNELQNPEQRSENPEQNAINPEPRSGEPYRTIKEPSVSKSAREIVDAFGGCASGEAVSSFIAYRRRTKGKALTVTAAKRLAANLKAIFDGGGNPDDALGMAEERGWLTIKPEWYFKESNNGNGNQRKTNQGDLWRSRAAEEIAFAARVGTSSR